MQLNFSGKMLNTLSKSTSKLFLAMKLTVFLLIIGSLHLSAKSFSQTITLNASNTDLEKVFSAIEKQSGYSFFYRYKDLAAAKPVSLQLKDASLEDALKACFKNEPFTYAIENKTIVVSKKDLMVVAANVAKITVTGTVVDIGNQPLPGTNVRVKGSTNGTVTDVNGKFSLTVEETDVLVFSFLGYKTREESVNKRTVINIQLLEDDHQMNEVVVVGYGNQERRNVTGAIGTVKMANVKQIQGASLDLKLAGQLAGVTVNQVTGTPGGGIVIRVRGSASVGAGDDPLYVIDGLPLSPGFDQYSNPLSTINPDDIESINVLKDASSTAIYGSRGANGVILITTKRAKKGQSTVSVNSFTGVQSILSSTKLKMMTASEFAQFYIERQQDTAAFKGVEFDPSKIPAEYRNPQSLGKGTNWYEEVTRPAPMQNYNVTVSNGTDKMRSLFSLGYFNQRGTVINTGFERYSFRANIDANITKDLTIGFSLAPTYNKRGLQQTDGHFEDGVLSQALLDSPLPAVKNPDGSYNGVITSPGAFVNQNPVNALVNTTNKYADFRALGNFYLNWEIVKGLNVKSTFNVDYNNNSGDYFRPSYVGGFRAAPPQLAIGSNNSSISLNWLNENTINYDHKWGDHSLTVLGGFTVQDEADRYRFTFGSGFPDDVIPTLNAATNITADGNNAEWRLLSLLSRVNYAYKDKYLLSASIRRDGASRFAPGFRWGTFPSVSGGWRISKESFFPKISFIDELKFTASYGLAGNNNIDYYGYVSQVDKANYVFGVPDAPAIAPGKALSELGNKQLGWETTKMLDIGMDLSLLQGRIYLIAEYYNRHTQSMLQYIDLPSASGFPSTLINVGDVRNRGVEFTLKTQNIVGKEFTWSSDFNISFNRNKVLNLGTTTSIKDAPARDNPTSITVVGQPLGMFYGYIFDGIFQNQAQIDSQPHFDGQIVGSIKYKDVSGPNGVPDGVIDGNDQTIIGNPYPNFTFGFNNHFTYKKFDLNIVVQGSQGGHVFDMYKQFTTNLDGVFNVEKEVIQRWRSPQNPGAGFLPTTVDNTGLARDYYPSYWVKSNSYIAFKDISLGYSFKTKFSQNLRVYASAQNALLITGYKGGNPEVGIDGQLGNHSLSPNVNFNAYPVAAVYTLGVNLTL